ncbi:MAG: thioredoxin [Nitrososphaerota archaeon]|nr:thioredoxin [Candidatus Bathyarchaeota archaeon]MDW8062182.1 thioredoxin [Nitrososphaerota archaeon]
MELVRELGDVGLEDFRRFIGRDGVIVIDFWAEWCMPCRLLAPIVEELASEYSGKVSFGKVNVDKPLGRILAVSYNITAVPTIIVFKDRVLVERIEGLISKDRFKRVIDRHLVGQ